MIAGIIAFTAFCTLLGIYFRRRCRHSWTEIGKREIGDIWDPHHYEIVTKFECRVCGKHKYEREWRK